MKKVLIVCLMLVLAIALAACGNNNSGTPTPAAPSGGGSTSGTPSSNAAPKEIVLGHVYAEDHNANQACILFKEFIEKESNGAMTVNIQPNSVLGGDEDMLEMCADGTVTLMIPSVASIETYASDWSVLSLPYLYSSVDGAYQAMDGAVGDYMKATLDGTDFVCVGFNSNGTRNMTNNVHPITGLADLKGLKMRVMNSSTYIKWMNALGANATPMGFNEVFTALQQGTVDGQENAAGISHTSGFSEVQKYFSLTEHVYDMNAIICSRLFYDALTADERALFDEGIKTYLEQWQRQAELDEDGYYKEQWEKAGAKINDVSAEAKQEFRTALSGIYAESQQAYPQVWELLEPYRNL